MRGQRGLCFRRTAFTRLEEIELPFPEKPPCFGVVHAKDELGFSGCIVPDSAGEDAPVVVIVLGHPFFLHIQIERIFRKHGTGLRMVGPHRDHRRVGGLKPESCGKHIRMLGGGLSCDGRNLLCRMRGNGWKLEGGRSSNSRKDGSKGDRRADQERRSASSIG